MQNTALWSDSNSAWRCPESVLPRPFSEPFVFSGDDRPESSKEKKGMTEEDVNSLPPLYALVENRRYKD